MHVQRLVQSSDTAWVMATYSRRPRSAAREMGPSSIVRLSAPPPPPVCCSPVALALPVYVATVAASVNGPMSHATRFRGGGLDTPGSAAGVVSGRYKRRHRRRPFPRHRQRSFTRARIPIHNNNCIIIIIFLIRFSLLHSVSPSLTSILSLSLTFSSLSHPLTIHQVRLWYNAN